MMNTKSNKFFNFNNKVVLVTGSNGIIGSELCKLFLDLGAFVFCIDNKKNSLKNSNYTHFVGDVANENFIKKKLTQVIKGKSNRNT